MRMSRRRVNSVIKEAKVALLGDYNEFGKGVVGTTIKLPPKVADLFSMIDLILTHKIEVTGK